MKKKRRNQMVITALALMIAVAGYLNFSGKEMTLLKESADSAENLADMKESMANEDGLLNDDEVVQTDGEEILASGDGKKASDKLSDADIPSEESDMADASDISDAADSLEAQNDDALAGDDEFASDDSVVSAEQNDTVETASSNKVANSVISAQISKEQNRSQNKELLMDIINSDKVSKAQKKEATNKLLELSDFMEKEAATEQVLNAKGYKNAMVSMSKDSVDVMVDLKEITDVDRAKIEDVVQRKTGVSINNIVISSIK